MSAAKARAGEGIEQAQRGQRQRPDQPRHRPDRPRRAAPLARAVLPAFVKQMRRVVAPFANRKVKREKKAKKAKKHEGAPADGKEEKVEEVNALHLHTSPPKHLYRCMEKMCLKPGAARFTAINICVVVRCIVECHDCSLMVEVLQALL